MFWKVRYVFFKICIYKLGTDILGILLVEKTVYRTTWMFSFRKISNKFWTVAAPEFSYRISTYVSELNNSLIGRELGWTIRLNAAFAWHFNMIEETPNWPHHRIGWRETDEGLKPHWWMRKPHTPRPSLAHPVPMLSRSINTQGEGWKDTYQNVNGSYKWKWNLGESFSSSVYLSVLFESFALNIYFSPQIQWGHLSQRKEKESNDLYLFPHLILIISAVPPSLQISVLPVWLTCF